MENTPKDNDPLEFVFGDLLDTFTEHETAVLATLTYFTEPAEVKWIAEIAKITATQAETALEDLADRSVLVVEDAKYLLPPLIATFLRHTRSEVVARAGNSLSDCAYALAQENGYRDSSRYYILDTDWPMVAASLPLIVSEDGVRLRTTSDALTYFLEYTGRWDDMLLLTIQAEERAVAAQDWYQAGWQAYRSGRVYRLRRQSAEVLVYADRAAKYWQTAQAGARERAFAIRLKGLGHELAKNYQAALIAYQEAVDLWRTLSSDSADVANGLNSIARVEQLLGEYDAAKRDYYHAVRIAKELNYREGIATYVGNLATLSVEQEDWPAAEQQAREALTEFEGVGRQEKIASCGVCLSKALARQERKTEGLPYAQRAVAIYTKLRSPDLERALAVLRECEEGTAQRIDTRFV